MMVRVTKPVFTRGMMMMMMMMKKRRMLLKELRRWRYLACLADAGADHEILPAPFLLRIDVNLVILVPGWFNVAAVVNVYLPAQITMRETLIVEHHSIDPLSDYRLYVRFGILLT